jgi:hypothetical protein
MLKKGENDTGEIAWFDFDEKQISVDEENLEKKLGADKLRPVLNHEVGHYKLCPFGLRGFVRLAAHAYKSTKNLELAKLAENLFADLLVNTHLYNKGEVGIKSVYDKFTERNNSVGWSFYISTMEYMIGRPGSILKNPPDEKVRKDAKQISDIMSQVLYKSERWPETIEEFAKYVKKYMHDEKQNQQKGPGQTIPVPGAGQGQSQGAGGNGQDDKQTSQNGENNGLSPKPLIDQHDVENFIPFDKDKAPKEQVDRYIDEQIRGISTEVGYDVFKVIVAGLGLGSRKQARIWFYKDLAASYSLDLPLTNAAIRTSKPQVPKKWRTSDPIERLNVEYSLSNFGVLVPNVTTYQFISEKLSFAGQSDETPDLLIALDSSGSMPNPDTEISFPVISAMLAAQAALDRGKKVAVVNFSSAYKYSNFTNNSNELDETIAHYFNGGTEIPGNIIKKLIAKHNHPVHVLIISDTEISNISSEIENLEYALKKGGAGGTIFIDCAPSAKTKRLTEIGFDVQYTRSFDDLADLTLKKAKGLYATVGG